MFYSLFLILVDELSILNVFRYITFRSLSAFLTALILSILIGPKLISWLTRLKCGQYIHEDVTAHSAKAGTPTMGGILIISSLCLSVLLWGNLANKFLWICIFVCIGFGLVGLWDDLSKLQHHKNRGISGKSKLLGQGIVALIAMLFIANSEQYNGTLTIPFFKDLSINLAMAYIPFGIFVMVGSSNAVNLTDGLDGLAIVPVVVTSVVLGIFIYCAGHVNIAKYLLLEPIIGVGEVAVFCAALAGSGLGFLWFNAYPAQVFMGDVGSLSLGGTLGCLALLSRQELILALAGGLFVVETLSVILQVGYFRWTGGKRIFKMAPLHHHFELKGIPESKIIIRFWIMSILLGLLSLSVLKLR